jgi:hypothetical protein
MSMQIRPVEYFYTTVLEAGEDACNWLSAIAAAGVNLLAFSATPVGPSHTQLTLFPEAPDLLKVAAIRSGITLNGPYRAFLVQGDDRLGAIADIYKKLCRVGVDVFASTGITDGAGRFGYLVYVAERDFGKASGALGVGT